MNRPKVRVFQAMVASAILISLAMNPLNISHSEAATGNQGIPARCEAVFNLGQAATFSCVSAGNVLFVDGQKVPTGFYFLVTDIVITPINTGNGTNLNQITFSVNNDTGQVLEISFNTNDRFSDRIHYTTPYIFLAGGEWLRGVNPMTSFSRLWVYVSGILTTNVNYLPLIMR